jgi:hypothetical protein
MRKFAVAGILMGSLPVLFTESALAQNPKPRSVNADPVHELWSAVKSQLEGPNGQEYFQSFLKDSALPRLVGTLISATPPEQPSVLTLAISDASSPEVTLRLTDDNGKEAHLKGPLLRGSQIQFEGVAVSFSQDPFMVTFEVSTSLRKPERNIKARDKK